MTTKSRRSPHHRCYSELLLGRLKNDKDEYAGMISDLSPRLVVEMSATPNPGISNLLVSVSGNDLRKEEMIKKQIMLEIQTVPDWKHLLDTVHANLERLEDDAKAHHARGGRYIRPIAIVRAHNTGKKQMDSGYTHVAHVKKYLMNKLRVREDYIKIQSGEQPDLEDIKSLMSEKSQTRWILTKEAIKEGWDCPFAYSLAILDSIKTHTSVTQLIGRVLRQPYVRHTGIDSLDQCYVYCHSHDTGAMAKHIKLGLSDIGMSDLFEDMDVRDHATITGIVEKRPRTKESVFLPKVLHKDGKDWIELEYERHILSRVDFAKIEAPDAPEFRPRSPQGWERTVISPVGDAVPSEFEAHGSRAASVSDLALRLSDVIPNVWQASRLSQAFMEKLRKSGKTEADIYGGMAYLTHVLRRHAAESVNRQAEEIFRGKIKSGDIRFDLSIGGERYRIKPYKVAEGKLLAVNGTPVQRTLFDPVYEEEFDTDLERSFAKWLDSNEAVRWWHRIAANRINGYSLRGWKKDNIYPDFIVMTNKTGDGALLGMYDTKGDQLENNPDTEYKRGVLNTLEGAFNCGTVTVSSSRMRGKFKLIWSDRFEEALS